MGYVLFTDLGEVVIMSDENRTAAALQRLLPARSTDEINAVLKGEETTNIRHSMECGIVTMDQYQHVVEALLGEKMDFGEFRKAHVALLTPNMPIIQLWRKLQTGGGIEKLIAVSNTDPVRGAHAIIMLGKMDIYFDAFVASYAVGARKPDTIMFQAALDLAGAPAKQCVMVDDKLPNVEAAQALGIIGIHYRANESDADGLLISDLEKIGIRV